MPFNNVDMDAAITRLAEKRIEEAMEAGKFDNLPGTGKPINLEDMPAEENQRMLWWALRLLKQNDVVPDEVRWRKQVDELKAQLATTPEPVQRQRLVKEINTLIHQLNTLGTNALKVDLAPLPTPD